MAFEKDYMSMTPEDAENLIASGQDTFRYKSVLVKFEQDKKENMWHIYAYYNNSIYLHDVGFNKKKLIGNMITSIDGLSLKGKIYSYLYYIFLVLGFGLIFYSFTSLFMTKNVASLFFSVVGGVFLILQVSFKDKGVKYKKDYITVNKINEIRGIGNKFERDDKLNQKTSSSNINITISKSSELNSKPANIDYKLDTLLQGNSQADYIEAKYRLIKKLSPKDQEVAMYKIIDRYEGSWPYSQTASLKDIASEKTRVADAMGDFIVQLYQADCVKGASYLLNILIEYMHPLPLHFTLMGAIDYLYSNRQNNEVCREEGIRLALLDFDYRKLYDTCLFPHYGDDPINMSTWKKGIKMLEEKGDYITALNICDDALNYNVTDGTKYGFQGTKERLQKNFSQVKKTTIINYPDDKQYVFVDVETAVGFYRICSIGMIIVEGNKTEIIYQLIDPGVHIDEGNTTIHGIKDDDVLGKPNFMSFWRTIRNQIRDDAVFVGHNVRFDLRKIHEDLMNYDFVFSSNKIIDTMDVSKQYHYKMSTVRGDLKLDTLANIFNINFNHHNALSDIQTTKEVLECLITKYDLNILDLEKKYNPNK